MRHRPYSSLPTFTLQFLAIALLASHYSCKPEATTSQQSPAPPTSEAAQEAAPDSGQWLVWALEMDNGPKVRTVAVSEDDNSVVGAHDGLVIADGVRLITETRQGHVFRGVRCPCPADEGGAGGADLPEACLTQDELLIPRLTNTDGRTVELSEYDEQESIALNQPIDETDIRVVWTGGAGPVLTGNVCTRTYGCGAAHGNIECVRSVWDLRTMEPWSFLGEQEEPEEGEPREIGLSPSVTAEGEFVWMVQYSRPTSFAGSDGYWDSYTTSTFEQRPTLAPPPAELLPPPLAVIEAAKQALGAERIWGWSEYEGEEWPPTGFDTP